MEREQIKDYVRDFRDIAQKYGSKVSVSAVSGSAKIQLQYVIDPKHLSRLPEIVADFKALRDKWYGKEIHSITLSINTWKDSVHIYGYDFIEVEDLNIEQKTKNLCEAIKAELMLPF